MKNTQHKLDKARPPRVQITYDVEIGEAKTTKELPLVLGVLGNFTEGKDAFRERKFQRIDKDNFNDIMASMQPCAELLVPSVLPEQQGQLAVSLIFKNIADFSPDRFALQIPPLQKLIKLREQLSDLRNRAASNEKLKSQLSFLLTLPAPPDNSSSGDDVDRIKDDE